MAQLEVSGFDWMLKNMKELVDNCDDVCEEMLDAGAEAATECWKDTIRKAGHVDTGAMLESVAAKRKASGSLKIREIYPQGKDSKGVRNAEKAYIIHYGTSYRLGDHFVDEIDARTDEAAAAAMRSIYDDFLDKLNF